MNNQNDDGRKWGHNHEPCPQSQVQQNKKKRKYQHTRLSTKKEGHKKYDAAVCFAGCGGADHCGLVIVKRRFRLQKEVYEVGIEV